MEKKWRKKKMNYYEVLRVPSTASVNEIKNAYKKLVKRYHPDIYEGNKYFAETKIKEINEAYETLGEKDKKAAYDARLNFERIDTPKENFVKTYSSDDINKYKNVYNNYASSVAKKTTKIKKEKKRKIDLNAIGKKYFFKLDGHFKSEEKENIIIIVLLLFILISSFTILTFAL